MLASRKPLLEEDGDFESFIPNNKGMKVNTTSEKRSRAKHMAKENKRILADELYWNPNPRVREPKKPEFKLIINQDSRLIAHNGGKRTKYIAGSLLKKYMSLPQKDQAPSVTEVNCIMRLTNAINFPDFNRPDPGWGWNTITVSSTLLRSKISEWYPQFDHLLVKTGFEMRAKPLFGK